MRPRPEKETSSRDAALRYFHAARLSDAQRDRWREFADRVPWAHYLQDPAWAEVERSGSGAGSRQPFFFWAEDDGEICLTAIGVRRRLPIPGRTFWEFKKGPTILDGAVLDGWLAWLADDLGHEVARLHVEPAVPLDDGGDDVETALERCGFVRRRALGTWATLLIDIDRDEDQIFSTFRPQSRARIRKSGALGLEVGAEDTPEGWSVLSGLDAEMAQRAEVRPISPDTVARVSRHWLANASGGTILVARHDSDPVAAALIITHRETAHLSMIPSSRRHRKLPASHLLVWEAMRWAKAHGCTAFDVDGYSLMARPGDALWGVNEFKRGFAPREQPIKCVAIHERVLSPAIIASAGAMRRLQAWRRDKAARDAS